MDSFLNLLPQENKKTLKKTFVILIAKRILVLVTIISFIFGSALFGTTFLFKQEIEVVKEMQKSTVVKLNQDQSGETLEDAIHKLNQTTERLKLIQDNHTFWTQVLAKIDELIPNDIAIEIIELNRDNKTIHLKGTANTRASYSNLRTNLTETEYIEDPEIPISLLKEEIPFSITGTTTQALYE